MFVLSIFEWLLKTGFTVIVNFFMYRKYLDSYVLSK